MKKQSSRWLLAALSPVALAVSISHAQTSSISTLADTVVTASRAPQPLTDVLADVTVIDREEIFRRGAASLAELLGELPGLQVSGDSGVYIRGAESRMTALYIDGVRVDSQDGFKLVGGGAHWDLVPLAQIDRIEVLRGPASAIYGSDAMGGVVQVFTANSKSGFAPFSSVTLGNRDTARASAGFSGQQAGWSYSIGLARELTDGHNARPDQTNVPATQPSANTSGNLRLGYAVSPQHAVELSHLMATLDTRFPRWGGGISHFDQGWLDTSALVWRGKWSDTYSTSVSVNRARTDRQNDLPYDYRTTTDSYLLDNRWRLGTREFSFALEQRNDQFDSKAVPSNGAIAASRSQNAVAAGFGQVSGSHTVQVSFRSDEVQYFGRATTGSLAYGYAFAPGWRASGSVGSAFRAPTLEQLFNIYGNRGLRPEESLNQEVAIDYQRGASSLKLAGYVNRITDMISSSSSREDCAAGSFCYYNVSQARIEGVTLSGKSMLGPYTVRGSLDLLNPENSATGKTLSLRAREQATLAIERPILGWQFRSDLLLIGSRFNNASNTESVPGYGVLGLGASKRLGQGLTLVLRADNLGGKQHWQSLEYATPGRTVSATLSWRP